MFKKIISLFLSLSLIITQPIFAQGVAQLNLAQYLGQARLSAIDNFRPTQLRYFSYDNLNNSFRILLDKGDAKDIKDNQLKQEARDLMDYFLIGLTLPNDAFWVNLRPDSPDNIIDSELEKTDLGRILLEADLQLKKDTAGLTSPQTTEGKAYWDKLYKKAGELFPAAGGSAFGGGSGNITIPTITRPWIVPGEIIVRESGNSAYIYKATLKVLLEQDHLKDSSVYNFSDPRLKELNEYSSQIIRETIIPKLIQEVNSSKRYAQLRQVYYSLVLSRWFKQKYSSLRSAKASAHQRASADYISLIDSGNLTNLTAKEPYDKLTYFKQYQESFAKGEYNLKEPVYTPYGQSVRSYISGGFTAGNEAMIISGVGTTVRSSIVEESLENRDNIVPLEISGNSLQIVSSNQKQPKALAASPLIISNENRELMEQIKVDIETFVKNNKTQVLSDQQKKLYQAIEGYFDNNDIIKAVGAIKEFYASIVGEAFADPRGRADYNAVDNISWEKKEKDAIRIINTAAENIKQRVKHDKEKSLTITPEVKEITWKLIDKMLGERNFAKLTYLMAILCNNRFVDRWYGSSDEIKKADEAIKRDKEDWKTILEEVRIISVNISAASPVEFEALKNWLLEGLADITKRYDRFDSTAIVERVKNIKLLKELKSYMKELLEYHTIEMNEADKQAQAYQAKGESARTDLRALYAKQEINKDPAYVDGTFIEMREADKEYFKYRREEEKCRIIISVIKVVIAASAIDSTEDGAQEESQKLHIIKIKLNDELSDLAVKLKNAQSLLSNNQSLLKWVIFSDYSKTFFSLDKALTAMQGGIMKIQEGKMWADESETVEEKLYAVDKIYTDTLYRALYRVRVVYLNPALGKVINNDEKTTPSINGEFKVVKVTDDYFNKGEDIFKEDYPSRYWDIYMVASQVYSAWKNYKDAANKLKEEFSEKIKTTASPVTVDVEFMNRLFEITNPLYLLDGTNTDEIDKVLVKIGGGFRRTLHNTNIDDFKFLLSDMQELLKPFAANYPIVQEAITGLEKLSEDLEAEYKLDEKARTGIQKPNDSVASLVVLEDEVAVIQKVREKLNEYHSGGIKDFSRVSLSDLVSAAYGTVEEAKQAKADKETKEWSGIAKELWEIQGKVKNNIETYREKLTDFYANIGNNPRIKLSEDQQSRYTKYVQIIKAMNDPDEIIAAAEQAYKLAHGAASPVIGAKLKDVGPADFVKGGIDFTTRAMKIGIERMGSFASSALILPEIADAAAIDLDAEFKQIQLMASSGIRPSDTRILEFEAACYYRGEFGARLGEITSCLQQAHFLDERLGRESSPALRLATILPEVL